MADTIRTLSHLLSNIFQDGQPPGSISAQDMRDLIITAFNDYARTGGSAGWRDLIGPLSAAKRTGTSDPTWTKMTDNGAGSTGVFAWSFSPSAINELSVSFHIDHDYLEGTAFYPHVHWAPSDASAGTVRWGLEWVAAQGHNQAAFGASSIIYLEQAAPGIANRHMIVEQAAPGITIPNAEPDMMIFCRIFRDATHPNDTYPSAAFGLAVDGHYQTNHHSTKNKAPNFYT